MKKKDDEFKRNELRHVQLHYHKSNRFHENANMSLLTPPCF